MKRFVNGIMEDPIWQKRVPQNVPEWLQTATVAFPSGRTAEELVANDEAHLVWAVNLGVIDFNPWPVRRDDLDHPDELRVDLDPDAGGRLGRGAARPRSSSSEVLDRARPARLPEDVGLQGHPRQRADRAATGTSSRSAAPRSRSRARSSGARPSWRRASGGRRSATACSSTTTRTRATAPSPRATRVRPTPDARVSCALDWDEVPDVEPGDLRLDTVPDAPDVRPATRPPTSTSSPARWTRCSTSRAATRRAGSATRRGRRTSRRAKGEPKRVQPSRDTDRPTQRGRAGDPQPGGPPPGHHAGRLAARLRLQAPHGPGPRARVRRRRLMRVFPCGRLRPARRVREPGLRALRHGAGVRVGDAIADRRPARALRQRRDRGVQLGPGDARCAVPELRADADPPGRRRFGGTGRAGPRGGRQAAAAVRARGARAADPARAALRSALQRARAGDYRPRRRADHARPRRGRRRPPRRDARPTGRSPTARCSATCATRSGTSTSR